MIDSEEALRECTDEYYKEMAIKIGFRMAIKKKLKELDAKQNDKLVLKKRDPVKPVKQNQQMEEEETMSIEKPMKKPPKNVFKEKGKVD